MITQHIIEYWASQLFVNEGRNLDVTNPQTHLMYQNWWDWQSRLAEWHQLSDADKLPYLTEASQYLHDWVNAYPDHSSHLLANFVDINQTQNRI